MSINGDLIKGWRIARFDEFLKRVERKIILDDSASYRCVGVRWYGIGAFVRESLLGMNIGRKQQWIIKEGDIVYNKLFAWKGSFAIADNTVDGCIVSDKFPTYQADTSKIDIRFLQYYFRMSKLAQQAEALSKGAAAISKLTLNPPQFWDLTIPLPPLEEQRRIVARIKELATRIEEVRGLRKEAMEEAEAIYSSTAVSLMKSLSNQEFVSIENIAEVRGGIQKGPHRLAGNNPVRYLTVAHVHRNKILLSDPRFFEVNPTELERWALKSGDVLIIEGNGGADQIGRTALFRGEIDKCVHQNHVIRIRPNQEYIDPEYLNLYLNSPVGQEEVQSRSRTTSGLRNLSVGRIKSIRILLPSFPEQRRMVAYLDDLQAKVDVLKQLQAETQAELDSLSPSILDKAFKGELV